MISRSPAQVVVSQEFADPGVVLTIRTTAEYDGFVRHDWELRAKKDLSLDEMALEVPLDPGLHFLFCWTRGGGTPQSGTMPAEYATSFVPFLWAGNERMGLSWFCRSDRNWLLDDPGRAIVVRRRPGGATLRFNLMNQRVGLKSGDRLKYTFAFQATPLRPMEKTTWDYRFHHISQTTHGPAEMRLKIPDAVLDKLAAGGVRTICFHEHWTDIESYPKTAYGDDLRSLVRRCHKRGIKLLLYLGFLISDLAPEWPYIGEECISMPKRGYMPYNYPPQPVQNAYIHCLHSAWADLLIDGIAALLDDFDVDGVYLDSTPMPFPCRNELHGCGYRRADGTVAPTFPVFAVRNWFKRLYTVIKQRKADGLIDAHVYDAMNSAALAYCTSYWNGEQLSPNPDLTKGLPLDRFRCEMMGVNWGVPAEFLHYRLGGYRQSHSLSLLHDVLVRAAGVNENFTLESSIWKLGDDFGRKQAEFLPYWRNERYVKVTGQHGYASLYRHPRNGVLAIVSNLGRREAKIGMRLELDQLGLAGSPLRAVDGLTGDPVAVKANRIELDLPAMGWRYVWFRKTK